MLALLVVAVAFVSAPAPQANKPKPPMVVYVNIDQLVGLHPGSNALAAIRALAAVDGVRGVAAGTVSVPALGAFSPDSFVHRPEVSRPEIEAEVAQSAVSALSRLETDQRRALQARLRATRATMIESAKSQIAAQVREIEQTAVFKERSLTAQLAPLRLENQIKQGTLKQGLDIMSKAFASVQETKPETQKPTAKAKIETENELTGLSDRLQLAQIELGRIDQTLTGEGAAIKAEAQQKVSDLRAGSSAGIEAKLLSTGNAERTKIEAEIAAARNEVLSGLSTPESALDVCAFEPEGPPSMSVGAVTAKEIAQLAGTREPRPVSVRASAPEIAARIRLDVSRAVSRIAAMEGLKVTFVIWKSALTCVAFEKPGWTSALFASI